MVHSDVYAGWVDRTPVTLTPNTCSVKHCQTHIPQGFYEKRNPLTVASHNAKVATPSTFETGVDRHARGPPANHPRIVSTSAGNPRTTKPTCSCVDGSSLTPPSNVAHHLPTNTITVTTTDMTSDGSITAVTEAGPDVSFAEMTARQTETAAAIKADPDVVGVVSVIGAGSVFQFELPLQRLQRANLRLAAS
mgnify:CR=1 FL=1